MRSHHLTECGRADALGARSRRRVDRRRLLRKSRVARRRAASCRRRPTFAHGAVGRSMTTTCAPRWPLSSRCATCWKASHMCGEGLPWGDLSSALHCRNLVSRAAPCCCCCCLHLLEDGGRGRPATPCTLPSQSTFTQSYAWLTYTGRTTRTMGARRRRFANVCSRAPRHRRCSPSPGSPQLAPVRLPLPPSPLDMSPAIAACAVVAARRRPASAPTLL